MNPAWAIDNGDAAPALIVAVNDGALHIKRSGFSGNGARAGIEIDADIAVDEHTAVRLDVRTVSRNVPNGAGDNGSEYPLNIQVDLELDDGSAASIMYAFNYDNAISQKTEPDFVRVATNVPQAQWSCNHTFWVKDQMASASRITKIAVVGNGWDFESYADRIGVLQISKATAGDVFVSETNCADIDY